MRLPIISRAILTSCLLSVGLQAQLNENCVVSVLNRTVQVRPDGTWVLPNIPANFGQVRARATCVENGVTRSGQSAFFTLSPNGSVDVPRIVLGPVTPIPALLTLSAPTTTLTQAGQTVQITVTGTYAGGTTANLTSGATGTQYLSSNPQLATVTANGLVSAVASGTVIIQAIHEGAQGLLQINIALSRDSDGDGILDDIEIREGLDPNNPADALDDPDRDGLNNRDELQRGTNIRNPDTDSDLIQDGEEVIPGRDGYITNPLVADTDGDGVPDGIEVATGSNPTNPASVNLAQALTRITVSPTPFIINVNTVDAQSFQQLTVTGEFGLGGTINLTSRARGTAYSSSNLQVCNFGAEDGRVFGANDGSCTITVTNAGFTAQASGTVRTFTPRAISQIAIPGYANNVDAAGAFAYVASGSTGLRVVRVSDPANPAIVGAFDTPGNANDVRIVGNLAFIADGSSGLQIINVTNPLAPVAAGTVDTPGDAIDVMVFGGRAYIADGAAGLAIVNAANPVNPTLLRVVDTPGTARGVDLLQGPNNTLYAIVADDTPAPALRVINVTDPATASLVASLPLQGSPKDLRVNGNFAYVAAYTGGLQIVDLTNPLAPLARGSLPSQFVPRDVEVAGNFALFAEQLFPNAVPVVDISNPSSPLLRTAIDFSGLGDYAGTGIAINGPFFYMTGVFFVASLDKGVTGDTRLFIGQYLPQQDLLGVPPQVSLTSPQNNSSAIRGANISLRANATDDVTVASVTFQVNGTDVFTDTSPPFEALYTVPLNATSLTITARALDLGGNVGTSAPISITAIPDPLTTVTGRVLDRNGVAVAGATVTIGALTGTTTPTGTFTFAGVPTAPGDIIVSASAVIGGRTLRGRSAPTPPVAAGTTNVGDIRLSAGRIGLIHCDSTGAIRNSMIATGQVAAEDLTDIDGCGAPPTLTSLSDFGAVLVWSNFAFSQPDALGNVLADFADQGGGVVIATYAFSSSWRIGGRIAASPYSPFVVGGASASPSGRLDLANSNTAHPILQGVAAGNYFVNSNYTNPALTQGATLLAVDTAGNRVISVNSTNRVVGISIFPGFGDMGRLFANALNFVR